MTSKSHTDGYGATKIVFRFSKNWTETETGVNVCGEVH